MLRNNPVKYAALRLVGILLCTLPPLICILCYFPVWTARGGERILPGITLVLCAAAALPLYKAIKRALRSPASYTLWLISFLTFLALSKIADEMVVISFVGFISNLMGAVIFKISKKYSTGGGIRHENEL